MAKRPSQRTRQTLRGVRQSGGSASRTKRISIPVGGVIIAVPAKVQSVVFKNSGTTDVKVRINATSANYYLLVPNEVMPKVTIQSATINAIAVSSPSELMCIFEG